MFPYLYPKADSSTTTSPKRFYSPLTTGSRPSHLLARFTLKIRQSLQLENILQASVQEIRNILKTDRVLVYRFNPDLSGYVAAESVSPRWVSILGKTIHDHCLENKWNQSFQQGLSLCVDDVYISDIQPCHLQMLELWQVKAYLVVPIQEEENLWGLLIAHHCQGSRHWGVAEVRFIQQLAVQVSVALQQAQLYEELQHNNLALEQSNRRLRAALLKEHELSGVKSKFLSVTSHEFRTPLTTIRSSTELLESFPCSEEEQQKLYRQVYQAVDYMVELLEDVRFMSRNEAEYQNLVIAPINLVEFCQSVLQEVQVSIAPDCHFSFIPKEIPPTLYMDSKLLRQILHNLLSNSVKYSLQNREIELNVSYENSQLTIQVRDQGIGIPEEDQPYLFETFYRGKNVGTIRGTGLGLSLTKRCVEAYGGVLTFESTVGQGTTFSAILPVQDRPKEDSEG
jgi:signal transduction histidine kinase